MNSQSGKGGIAHLLNLHYGLELPRSLQVDFAQAAQQTADRDGRELAPKELWEMFQTRYLAPVYDGPVVLSAWRTIEVAAGEHEFVAELSLSGNETQARGTGNGPLAALTAMLAGIGIEAEIVAYSEHAVDRAGTSLATAYVQISQDGTESWGVGQDTSVLTASIHAVIAAVNRPPR
ncbi:hypothetical protein MXD59_04970 [Frankia sp. Ag45/Mut15]|uniref:2-isopropylmalate synthase LeuA allosteric (dimerisation) domain-containing protein n=1 Tax=Frankia umida TaxID=573489 RepID=A0ABT0JUR7_9ACTN|nr:alpha-isopropylmalate synthase regulatory domain-containing protein [Frankia umida]MCK9875140.1 hypothetical protein [Frankia umida]